MRNPERVPMILSAIERNWPASRDEHLGEFLMAKLNAKGWPWHPLCTTWDGRLIELLAEAWPQVDLSDALSAAKANDPWTPVDRAVLFPAIESVWASLHDMRLGQAIHVAFRHANPDILAHALFNIEDGAVLAAVGDLTTLEQAYVDGEPEARRRGWAEWERARIEQHRAASGD